MRFWDTSAIVPLGLRQPLSARVRTLLDDDDDIAVWWGTAVECVSAVARLRRQGGLTPAQESQALVVMRALAERWTEVLASGDLREFAIRLVRVHPLRAADALQLAAALVWSDGTARGRALVTLDEQLAHAARLEGFTVLPDVA